MKLTFLHQPSTGQLRDSDVLDGKAREIND